MYIKNANCSESGRNKNRNRGNLGGKKEQMKKSTMVSVFSVLSNVATVAVTLLSGCASSKRVGVTSTYSTGSYYGGGSYGGYSRILPIQKQPAPATGQAKLQDAISEGRPAPSSQSVLPSYGDEVWIIARKGHDAVPSQDAPGSGALMTKVDQKEVLLPLKHTEFRDFIQGFIGTVEVSQQFQNPYSSKIEAVYVF